MAFEQREGQGSLFREKDKKNPAGPDYTGTALIDGKNYRIAGWLKVSANGTRLALSFEDKSKARPKEGRAPAHQAPDPFDDQEIPF